MMYGLTPNNGQKSFYGKAHVIVKEDGSKTLISYSTPIITINTDGTFSKLWDGWTDTTGKHIKAFCGLNKKEFMDL